jgi:PAS domain S-box-containing protein
MSSKQSTSDARFTAISNVSPDGIMTLSIFGYVTYVNPAFLRLTGFSEEDFVGKHIIHIPTLKGLNVKPFLNIQKNIMRGNLLDSFMQFPYNRKDGTQGIGDAYFTTLNINGKRELISIVKDVTKQIELEKENKRYTENLEKMVEERTQQIMDNEKMVTMAQVSSMITHDLKGPLQIINNSLHLINLKPDEQARYLEFIRVAVKQANELLEEFSMQGKKTPLNLEYVYLEDIIEESLLHVKTSEKIDFETINNTKDKVRVDRSKMLRVISNLIKNAVEAMPNGGNISIIVKEESEHVTIKIKDTGVGIPKDKLNNLFRPFRSTKTKGMGLGLTFCKETIQAHKGTISVESKLGKGTTFTLKIPKNIDYDLKKHMESSGK